MQGLTNPQRENLTFTENMKSIVDKEKELSYYLEEWVDARYGDWLELYNYMIKENRIAVNQLKSGDQLIQLLGDILGNIEEHFSLNKKQHLIPSKFSSLPQLLQFLSNLQSHVKSKYKYINANIKDEETDYVVFALYKISNDIDQMVSRCQDTYSFDESIPIPYRRAQQALLSNDIGTFYELMRSLIKNVPYNIHKEKLDEGYFHTIIHTICSVLGIYPISEAETSDGRIDMFIECPNRVFLFEFKYSGDNKDRSKEALKQIKDKNYAESYHIKGKPIVGIGLSFSQKTRNLDYYISEELYFPPVLPLGKPKHH